MAMSYASIIYMFFIETLVDNSHLLHIGNLVSVSYKSVKLEKIFFREPIWGFYKNIKKMHKRYANKTLCYKPIICSAFPSLLQASLLQWENASRVVRNSWSILAILFHFYSNLRSRRDFTTVSEKRPTIDCRHSGLAICSVTFNSCAINLGTFH